MVDTFKQHAHNQLMMRRNYMIRRFLLASALLVTGTVAVAPSAFAGTIGENADQTVGFEGNVAKVCVFGSATGATLNVNGNNSKTLTTSEDVSAQGKTNVTCNYGATLKVAAPIPVTGDATAPALSGAELTSYANPSSATLTSSTINNGDGGINLKTGELTDIYVGMTVNNHDTVIPAGKYNYNVTLTVTP